MPIPFEEKRIQEKTFVPQIQQTSDRSSVVSHPYYPEKMKVDAAIFEHDMSNAVDTECGDTLLVTERDLQQDLAHDESAQFPSDASVKSLHPLKPDFPFTNVVFGKREKIYSDPLKPPNAISIPAYVYKKNPFYPREYVISAGHDHQTPPIFVDSRGYDCCFSFMFSCVERTQHDPPYWSNNVS